MSTGLAGQRGALCTVGATSHQMGARAWAASFRFFLVSHAPACPAVGLLRVGGECRARCVRGPLFFNGLSPAAAPQVTCLALHQRCRTCLLCISNWTRVGRAPQQMLEVLLHSRPHPCSACPAAAAISKKGRAGGCAARGGPGAGLCTAAGSCGDGHHHNCRGCRWHALAFPTAPR